jgi:methionyl-tRNA synthetase
MLEYIQTDVYVRARRLAGDDVVFMWADDTHGTPVQLRARREGMSPEELVGRAYEEHVRDFRDFGIGYDIFHTTHSAEVRECAEGIFAALRERGDIVEREVEQLYCEHDAMFLPDRFVRGTCPRCSSVDQYGDACEKCGGTYAPTELGDPHCALCGATPALRGSLHLFVPLARHAEFLREWLRAPEAGGRTRLQPAVRNYVMDWVDAGLRDWDISRDGPYFGFEIPGYPGKYFYVWFDAPIGYIGATKKWCAEHQREFASYWRSSAEPAEIVHVIGKDIVYFHCLFWPAMLNAAGYTTPERVQVHGWLTVNGEKMSKSRGTFILARTYLDHLPPDYLRYYFASKLSGDQDDIDLSLEDFAFKVNADLVKKAANLASRSIKFVHQRCGARLGAIPEDAAEIVAAARARLERAPELYREFESGKVMRLAMEVADDFNLYLTRAAPWKLRDDGRARDVCTAAIFASKVVATLLKPVLPRWAARLEACLQIPPLDFASGGAEFPPHHPIGPYETLAEPIDPKALEAIVEASKEDLRPAATHAYSVEPLAAESSIEALAPVDLRVAKVTACSSVDGSDKLLRLELDVGPLGTRTVFSGIARSYSPEGLVGKHVVLFANLKPRKMRFGVSEGMVLAAGAADDAVVVLELGAGARPGEKVT